MAVLNEVKISAFRGIKNLLLNNLGAINLIVGDNNSGKTSILESLQLFRKPNDVNNLYRVALVRDSFLGFYRLSTYESFINMFTKNNMKICVSCLYSQSMEKKAESNNLDVTVEGHLNKVLVDYNELRNKIPSPIADSIDTEMDQFTGRLYASSNHVGEVVDFSVNKLTPITGRVIQKPIIKINYLSPIDHMSWRTFNNIIRNEKYKEICIKVLQIFDKNIEDLVMIKSELPFDMSVECIKNKKTGLMPLSTYGDGIKKVLAIANAIASSTNGILLIDELETSIHAKYYDDIFNFIIKAAQMYHVQLFITTHSIEAVDGLLKTRVSNEKYNTINDPFRIITLRKDEESGNTLSRIMTGGEVYFNREKFNFEVRV